MDNSSNLLALLRLLEMELSPNADHALLILATVLRLTFSILWILVTIIFTRILLKRKVFHVNVQCLLIALPVFYGVIIVPNTILEAAKQFNIRLSFEADITLKQITSTGIFGTTFNLFAFVFERIIATMLVHRYEYISARVPLISLSMLLAQWTGATVCIALNYSGHLTLLPLLIIVGVEWAISVVMFSFLPAFSRRAYEKAMRNSSRRYRNRYQSIENIRTALVLNRLVLFLSMAILLMLAYYTVMSYWTPTDLFNLLYQYFHVICALTPSIACFIVIFNHDALKKDLQKYYGCFKRKSRVVSEVTLSSTGGGQNQIRSISGVNLVIPIENHHDHYFQSLHKQWD